MVYTCPDETHSYNYLKISQIFLGPHFSEIIQSHYIQSHSEIIQSLCVRALHAPIGLNGPDQPQQDPPPACPLPVRPESPFQLISLSLTELHHTTVSLQLCLMLFLIGLPGWTPSWTHHCILPWLLTMHRTSHCHQYIAAQMLWDYTLSVSSLVLGQPFTHSFLWSSLPLLLPGNYHYTKSTLKWNTSMKGQTLEKKINGCIANSRGNEAAHLIFKQENCCGTSRYSRLHKKSIQKESGQVNTLEYSGYTV